MIKALAHSLRRFRRREDGNVTIEFAILFPSIIAVFLSAFEAGFLMMRQVTLDRGVDIAVRDLRLGNIVPLNHETLKDRICANAFLIADCDDVLFLELQPVSTDTWQPLDAGARCIDREAENLEPTTEDTHNQSIKRGIPDQLMMVRACVVVDPFAPMIGLGLRLPEHDSDGGYALTSTSAFVNEP